MPRFSCSTDVDQTSGTTPVWQQLDNLDDAGIDRDEIIRGLARARQRLGDYDGALTLWSTARAAAELRNDTAAWLRSALAKE